MAIDPRRRNSVSANRERSLTGKTEQPNVAHRPQASGASKPKPRKSKRRTASTKERDVSQKLLEGMRELRARWDKERDAWLRRRRIHTGIFEKIRRDAEIAQRGGRIEGSDGRARELQKLRMACCRFG